MARGFRDLPRSCARGFSLVEIVVVITIIGVMAMLLLPSFHDLLPGSKYSTALANLELLNQSVLRYNQANKEIVLTSAPASTSDEEDIAKRLQYRGPDATASPGSPFLDPTLTITSTDGVNTYRASWNGRMFQMVQAGTVGSGLDLLQMTSSGVSRTYEAGYKPPELQ